MEETWKSIPSYEGLYQVSSLGNVKSLKFGKERILTNTIRSDGYSVAGLSKNGIEKKIKTHQLVAMAFLEHKPNGYTLVVDHINGNPSDNRLENLQLITQRENTSKKIGNFSSKYKGVCWNKALNKWMSSIRINGKSKHLGYFNTEQEASEAYQNKLKEII